MTNSTPYTHSRARVLLMYRQFRQRGILPIHAMEAVLTKQHRALALCSTYVQLSSLDIAKLEWDIAHAKRYLGWIQNQVKTDRVAPYWKQGKTSC